MNVKLMKLKCERLLLLPIMCKVKDNRCKKQSYWTRDWIATLFYHSQPGSDIISKIYKITNG